MVVMESLPYNESNVHNTGARYVEMYSRQIRLKPFSFLIYKLLDDHRFECDGQRVHCHPAYVEVKELPEKPQGSALCSDGAIAPHSNENPDVQSDGWDGHHRKEYICIKEPATMQPAQEGAEVPSEFPRVMEFHAASILLS